MLHDLLARPMAKQPLGYIRVHCVDPDLFLRILHDTADTHAACRSLEKWLGRGHRQGQGDVGAVVRLPGLWPPSCVEIWMPA